MRPPGEGYADLARATVARAAMLYRALVSGGEQLELQLVGRVLFHTAVVGVLAGGVGAALVFSVEWTQEALLSDLAGYQPLCAAGEICGHADTSFRPWLLALLPVVGALLSGLVSYFLAPETFSGGGNQIIEAFHSGQGNVRARVLPAKVITTTLTLGFGGSGGREGPTMLIGGALGSLVGRLLRVSPRERRILLVAGVAAGVSAVFRTPLGAALLAVEVFHRDDFESDALVPAVLASVIGFSVLSTVSGETALFAHAEHYSFDASHLPLYLGMAIAVSAFGWVFVRFLHGVEHASRAANIPGWARPALGGLGVGLLMVPVLWILARETNIPDGQGLGILGGSYGAGQIAITGADFLPGGWLGVGVLLLLAVLKLLATGLTVGTGGSAGDFGPSLVMGGLVGGAFGRAAQILWDPTLDPGAFALVGMGTFYGGVAHVPLAALVLVSELAGSYDLLVPMMFCGGIAFIANRRNVLYPAQRRTRHDSPAHRSELGLEALRHLPVSEAMSIPDGRVSFPEGTLAEDAIGVVAGATRQHVFPLVDANGVVTGMVTTELLRLVAWSPQALDGLPLAEVSGPPVTVQVHTPLGVALERMLEHHLRELVVVDDRGAPLGVLDETDVARAHQRLTDPNA